MALRPALRRALRIAVTLAVAVPLLILAHRLGVWIEHWLAAELTPQGETTIRATIFFAFVTYTLLMALPFVPGVEIGLALIAMFGARVVPLVYGGTVLALTLSFLAGRLIPQSSVIRILAALRMRRAAALLESLDGLAPEARLSALLRNPSSRLVPRLLRHRHLALAAAFNLPGNSLVGGGGGIGLAAGFSRLFGFADYVLTVALAVAPVPVIVLLFGS